MFLSSKRNRRILGINLLILGMLLGFQNCADNGAAFESNKIASTNGTSFNLISLTGNRYIGDTDTFTVRPAGDAVISSIAWTIILPDDGNPSTSSVVTSEGIQNPDGSNTLSFPYTTLGDHIYDVRINNEVSYNFTVRVLERPGCTAVNGNSLRISGASTLARPGNAIYSILVNESCFNLQEVRQWRVLDSNGNEVLDGSPIINAGENTLQFSFLRNGTYRVEADVRVSQLGDIQTLFIPVVVGNGVECNPADFEISTDTTDIFGLVNFNLELPECFDATNVSHYTWDFNYDGQNSEVDFDSSKLVNPKSTNANFEYTNFDGMIRYGAMYRYGSRILVTVHYSPLDFVSYVDRTINFNYVEEETTPTPTLNPFDILNFGDSEAGGGVSNIVTITGITSPINFQLEYVYKGDNFLYRKNGGIWVSLPPLEEQTHEEFAVAVIPIQPNDTLQFRFVGNEDQAYFPQGSARVYLDSDERPLLDSFSFIGGRP